MKRVAITGIGMIDSLGDNPKDCFENMLNEYNPTKNITKFDISKYPNIKINLASELKDDNKYNVPKCEENRKPDYIKAALHSVSEAIKDSGISNSENVAVIYSSLNTCGSTKIDMIHALSSGKSKFSPKLLLENQLDYISGYISQTFGFTGMNTGMNTACSTSLSSLDYAVRLVDEYDYIIVGGSDTIVDPLHLYYFQQFQVLTNKCSQPFDKNRSGFLLGEGAGCIILESEEKALARNAKIYGYISGIGIASESQSQTGLNKDASKVSITRALKQSNVNSVDFVHAHATSTILGDEVEYRVIKELLPNTPIVSSKGKLGHTMGACGILELIYGLLSMENSIIPKNFNLNDPLEQDTNLLMVNLPKTCKSFLKNSFAFGGRCVSVVITS